MEQTADYEPTVTDEMRETSAVGGMDEVIFIYSTFLAASGAFILNGFNFVVMMTSEKMRQKPSLVFFAHQNGCDGVTAALVVMFYLIEVTYGEIEGFSGRLYCHIVWPFFLPFIGLYAGIFNTVFMSVERYVAIVHPLKYRRFACKKVFHLCILSCWILSIILNAPVVYGIELRNGQCIMSRNNEMIKFTYIVVSVTVSFIAPIIFISVLYAQMFVTLKLRRKDRLTIGQGQDKNCSGVHDSSEQTDKMYVAQIKLARLAMVIELSAIISWAPFNIYMLLSIAKVELDFADLAAYASALMSVFNLIVNPIVFISMCEDFQITIKKLFKSTTL